MTDTPAQLVPGTSTFLCPCAVLRMSRIFENISPALRAIGREGAQCNAARKAQALPSLMGLLPKGR